MPQCDEYIYRAINKTPIVFIMCGVPASGKSYYAKNVLMKNIYRHRVYISSDDIREEICGDAGDQSKNWEVFELFYERARKAVQEGSDVVLDATHLTKKTRRRCRDHFKDLDCKFIAVQMNTSILDAIYRNKKRDRVVPADAMSRMINAFQPVEDNEGFDYVWKVDQVMFHDNLCDQ